MLKKRFGKIGLDVHFIDAVRGKNLTDAQKSLFNGKSRQGRLGHLIKDNAIGCALSHHKVWQTIIDNGEEYAFVFEDDAVALADDAFAAMKTLTEYAQYLDIVTLANRRVNNKKVKVRSCGPSHEFCVLKGSDIGSESYFITGDAAKRMLGHQYLQESEIDMLIHHWWHHDCQVLHLFPPLFTEENRPSSIGYGNLDYWPDDTAGFRVKRRLHRISNSIKKRSWFAAHFRKIQKRFQGS